MERLEQELTAAVASGATLEQRAQLIERLITCFAGLKEGQGGLIPAITSVLESLPQPDAQLFTDVDGAPAAAPSDPAAAAAFAAAAATHLAALGTLLQQAGQEGLPSLGLAALANPDAPHFSGSSKEAQPQGPHIEELSDEAEDPTLCVRLVLAAALYVSCPPLPTPWALGEAPAAATRLLAQLAAALVAAAAEDGPQVSAGQPTAGAAAAGAVPKAGSEEALGQLQRLALAVLPLALQQLRPSLVRGSDSAESGQGPDAFQRCLAGTQLAWLLCQMRGAALGAGLRLSFPLLLACLDDSSPSVHLCGLAMLSHCVAHSAEDLRWQGGLLIDRMNSLLGGCDQRIWPLAVSTSVGLVKAVEGPNPYAASYSTLLSQLLSEVERHPSQPDWAAPALRQLPGLAECLKLQLVPQLPRLLPLLMHWLSFPAYGPGPAAGLDSLMRGAVQEGSQGDGSSEPGAGGDSGLKGTVLDTGASVRVLVLQALHAVVLWTWPRMPAHAGQMWSCLEQAAVVMEAAGAVKGAGMPEVAAGSGGAEEQRLAEQEAEEEAEQERMWMGKCASLLQGADERLKQRAVGSRLAGLVR